MGKWLKIIVLMALMCVIGVTANAAKAKAKPKPAAKKPTVQNHATLGTTQLKGEYAELGSVYTLGKDDPLNITIKSAEYTVEPVRIGDDTYVPKADEKFLVLHMIYHNSQPRERFTRWDSIHFTVVDPQDQNHDGLTDLGMENARASMSMNMKPAQKIGVYGFIIVPAAGEMPKLIAKSGDNLVLRYDLKGKVKSLPAQYADPADKTGATALAKVVGQMETDCPLGLLSVKLHKVENSTAAKIGEYDLRDGSKFVIVNLNIKNQTAKPQFMRWDTFVAKMLDGDGTPIEDVKIEDLYYSSRDKGFSGNLEPGQDVPLRLIFSAPSDVAAKTLTLCQNEGRTFCFDISGAK